MFLKIDFFQKIEVYPLNKLLFLPSVVLITFDVLFLRIIKQLVQISVPLFALAHYAN